MAHICNPSTGAGRQADPWTLLDSKSIDISEFQIQGETMLQKLR